MGNYVMGIDVGTTGTKSMIFDFDSNIIGVGYQEYSLSTPKPNWFEADAEELVQKTFAACRIALENSGLDPEQIAAISFSSQRATVGFVDENDHVIENIMYSWLDIRANEEAEFEKSVMDEAEQIKRTGMPVSSTFTAAKVIWFKNHKPELYKKTKYVVLISAYLMKRFGSEKYYCDWGNASATGVFNMYTLDWDKELLEMYGLDFSMFPETIDSGKVIGSVSAEAALATGLSCITRLISGSGDQSCGAFGAAVVRKGTAELTIGTAGHLITYLDQPLTDDAALKMMTVVSVPPNQYELNGIQLSAAVVYRWFRDCFGGLEKEVGRLADIDPYVLLDRKAMQSPPGANGLVLLPYFAGNGSPHWDAEATGVLMGLTLKHTQGDTARAFMEGVVYEIREMKETMERSGAVFNELNITGGATKSPMWCQMIADILNLPIRRLIISDATVLGAAMIAAVGVGRFSSFQEAAEHMVKLGERIEPIPENTAIYNKLYRIFRNMYASLQEGNVFHDLSEVRAEIEYKYNLN